MQKIFEDIQKEKLRQDQKWGAKREYPSVCPILTQRQGGCTPLRMAEEYEMPSEVRAKQLCDSSFTKGQPTWAHIAVEEMAEVIGSQNDFHRRTELVQLAAVLVQWIENIDRSNTVKMETKEQLQTTPVRQRALEVIEAFHPHATGQQNAEILEGQELINDLGFDSLDIIELIMSEEKEFSINIPDSEAEKVVTVKDLLDLVESKVK